MREKTTTETGKRVRGLVKEVRRKGGLVEMSENKFFCKYCRKCYHGLYEQKGLYFVVYITRTVCTPPTVIMVIWLPKIF